MYVNVCVCVCVCVCVQVFEEIGAVDPLRKAAREGTYITSSFSCQALRLSCQLLPGYCFWNVLQWDSAQVEQWVCACFVVFVCVCVCVCVF